jgi:HPt (histidine-containing phosphotransfer) domain-containing protein
MSDQVQVLDRALALSRVDGDEDLLREIAALFLDDYPNLEAKIREAVVSQDAQALERASHTLKGSVANFAADAVFRAALDLEMIGRSQDLSGVDAAFQRLLDCYAALHPELLALADSK